jgi:hypothetical protein
MQLQRYYLADSDDRTRLADDGTVAHAHECTPQYFDSPDDAYRHPASAGLVVHAVPATETIPGAGIGADFAIAADTYAAADPSINPEVYARIAAEVAAICAAQ